MAFCLSCYERNVKKNRKIYTHLPMLYSKRKNHWVYLATGGLLSVLLNNACASEEAKKGFYEEIKNFGFEIGGWANAGITYNTTAPENNFNGPVTFNDRSGEFQLNQLYGFLERAANTEGGDWDWGVRFDALFGTDTVFTQAFGGNYGNWDYGLVPDRFYQIAIPQAHVQIFAPFGNGINIKAGRFYTPVGYEVVTAPDSFFYSRAYIMQFGQPFTHTGVLANYAFDKNWSVLGGVTTGSHFGGWDGNFEDGLGNWSGVGGVIWTSNDAATSLNISGTYGATSETNSAGWGLYSIVLKHDFTDRLHTVLEHSQGFAGNAANGGTTDAKWYGIMSHVYYDIQEDLTAGIRAVGFWDHNGIRVFSPARELGCPGPNNTCVSGSYYGVTAGITWKPRKWLRLRPNIRYDWSEDVDAFDVDASGIGQNDDQFLFSTDVTVTF